MKGGNKPGFGGFGSAMFSINDIQNMYGNIDPKPQQPKKPMEVKPKPPINEPKKATNSVKKIVPTQQTQKPKIILKPSTAHQGIPKTNQIPINKAPIQMSKKQPSSQSQKTILSTKPQHLFSLQVGDSTFQLSLSKKPTQWGYHIFQEDGKNAKQIVPNPQITFSLHERNIRQGSIGNCYFICSLAALTKNIQIIKKRIPDYEKYNQTSQSFKVNMFQSGKLVQINILNSFKENFSKPIENDITSLILQKAYAQLYGNYQIINMGHSIDSFRDLSGHIAQYLDLKDKNKCAKQIIEAFEKNHPMVIASKTKPQDQLISGKHSYNLLSYSYKNGNFFVQLRDPRGWTKAMFNVPEYLESQVNNGQFWLGYEDLVKNFQVITVSRYVPNSLYYYKTYGVKDIPTYGLKALMFQVNSQCTIGFSIHQKHKKFFDKDHHYNVVNLMVCEADQKGLPVRTLKTNFNAQQVCSLSLELTKGTYAVVGQIYPFKPSKQPYPQQIFTLSLNSSGKLSNFGQLPNFNVQTALTLYMQHNRNQFKPLISQQKLHRHHGSLYGKMCILYQNHSGKSVIEELDFQTENIQVKQKKVVLQEGQIKLLIHPIGWQNNCSHKCVFKSRTIYKK